MPISGKLYTALELRGILGIERSGVSMLATRQGWDGPQPGLYWAESVEPTLFDRGIDPVDLPVVSFDHPEGMTLAAELEQFAADYAEMEAATDEDNL